MSKKSGILIGALVGAAAALFLAPKKGEDLRDDAGKLYDDFKENPQEALNNWKDKTIDYSTEKFNDVKDKFDSGEISADRAKDFLFEKRDLIKEKVDSGELSKESVIAFFNATRDAIVDKINEIKSDSDELFDENESEFSEEVKQAADKFESKVDETAAAVGEKADEVKNDLENHETF